MQYAQNKGEKFGTYTAYLQIISMLILKIYAIMLVAAEKLPYPAQ